ncbi:hypothetical protein NP493_1562g00011 [Ridgeia piscesae]|uniref:Uncharacterized protein n=1 Tax=Ridgeia piscesae TaxID=27915 RepID=A0AAD9JYQ8_RIDPI|nr:hypothetical protein NP493_1562g00011 [Ridgeia piscesae]
MRVDSGTFIGDPGPVICLRQYISELCVSTTDFVSTRRCANKQGRI